MKDPKRIEYLQAFVLGTPEAVEFFSWCRDQILSTNHHAHADDPHRENAKSAFAIAQEYQSFINFYHDLQKGLTNARTSTGNPTTE